MINPRQFRTGSRRFVAGLAAAVAFLPALAQAEPNAQMQEVLSTYGKLSPVPIEKTTPVIAKAAPTLASAVKLVMTKDGKKASAFTGKTEDIKIAVGDHKLEARVYTPAGDGPFPTILYIHGGGWVIGSVESYDATPRALCELTKAVVISTEYRQAPANKFPAAHEDTLNVYNWVLANAGQYKGDPKKVAVAGESAGGNMAAEICVQAKAQNLQMPVHQLLVYPVVGYAFATQFADRLQAAGVPVQYKLYTGVTHEFFSMGAVIDEAKQAEEFAAEQLKAAFAK